MFSLSTRFSSYEFKRTILTTALRLKEYFGKVVGPVKTCLLTYGPDGRSRGVATITFNHTGDAEKAALSYNGVLVDNRPMKVELVLEPKTPGLESRIGAPNKVTQQQKAKQAAKPKPVTSAPKSAANNARGRQSKRGRGGRPGGRPKPKTAEELDAEMADYWDGGAAPSAGAPAGAAPAAPAGGEAMDEIL